MDEILEVLEKNCRYSDEEIAKMLGKSVEEVKHTIKEYEDNGNVSILADNYVYECRNILKRFVETNYNISYDYINFITAICWISMTPLYFLNPLCKLLFYMGKLTMYQSLINMKKEED